MVIDSHLHLFPDTLAYRAVTVLSENSGLIAYTDGTTTDTLKKLDVNGVDKAVVLNIAKKPNQDKKVNDFAIAANCERLIHFGSVNPYSDGVEEELERLVRHGIKGIKLHPEYQQFRVDDPIADKVYNKCTELGMIVAFHAGWDIAYPTGENAHPRYLAGMLDKHPNMKVQLAHFGGMLKWEEAEKYVIGRDCYIDISMCGSFLNPEQARRMIDNHGIERMLFGTDCPWENWEVMYEFVDKLGLNEVEKEKLMHANAEKMLGL